MGGGHLGDFLVTPACPIEKVTLWEGLLYLMLGSETDRVLQKDRIFFKVGFEPGGGDPKV